LTAQVFQIIKDVSGVRQCTKCLVLACYVNSSCRVINIDLICCSITVYCVTYHICLKFECRRPAEIRIHSYQLELPLHKDASEIWTLRFGISLVQNF